MNHHSLYIYLVIVEAEPKLVNPKLTQYGNAAPSDIITTVYILYVIVQDNAIEHLALLIL